MFSVSIMGCSEAITTTDGARIKTHDKKVRKGERTRSKCERGVEEGRRREGHSNPTPTVKKKNGGKGDRWDKVRKKQKAGRKGKQKDGHSTETSGGGKNPKNQ